MGGFKETMGQNGIMLGIKTNGKRKQSDRVVLLLVLLFIGQGYANDRLF
jgi:hypothetical protein